MLLVVVTLSAGTGRCSKRVQPNGSLQLVTVDGMWSLSVPSRTVIGGGADHPWTLGGAAR